MDENASGLVQKWCDVNVELFVSLNRQMCNGLWLLLALPAWYFEASLHPLRAGVLSFFPFLGTLGLLAGAAMGLLKRRSSLALFFPSFAASECYVAIAGLLRGQLRGNASLVPFCIFVLVQLVLVGHFAYRARRAPLAVLAFTVFLLSYAFLAWLIGGMAFADSWL